MVNFFKARLFKLILTIFISASLGSMLTICLNHVLKPAPQFSTVNITKLVDEFIQSESEKHASPEVLKNETNQFGQKLELALQALSKEKHLILFPREAVIAGCSDYTDFVKQQLFKT